MWSQSARLCIILTTLNVCSATSSNGQIIPQAKLGFEYVSWGETPTAIKTVFAYTWLRTYGKQENRNIGSGRTDVFPLATKTAELGTEIFVQCEFAKKDSGLISVTMIAGGLTGMYEVSEDFVDAMWDMNLDRFGEPTGGKWIPLVGESKEWTVGSVFIKMIRMDLPASGILVKYVLMEEKRDGDEGGAVRDPAREISADR